MFDLMPHRRRPGRDLTRFRDEMDNLFNHFFDLDIPISRRLFGDGDWVPRVDVSESDGEITIKAEIPGCDASDIDVKLDGRSVVITGEKKQGSEEKTENYHRIERAYGSFCRTVALPTEVDPENIEAVYKKGVLKLVFKKSKETEVKKIQIKT